MNADAAAVPLCCCQVTYLAKRLSSLLLLPDARQMLMRLPQPLLQQLLSSEALEVEQVGRHAIHQQDASSFTTSVL